MTRDVEEVAKGLSEGDRPSQHGRAFGRALAAMAVAGNGGKLPTMCSTCAFREGTLANMSAGTGMIAHSCALGIDDSPFGCHHGMANGEPSKLCEGWLAAKNAPFDVVKSIHADLTRELDSQPADDAVRADFDEWLARVDPDGALDVYQAGRRLVKDGPFAHLLAQDKSQ